jgi:hypothetical protein
MSVQDWKQKDKKALREWLLGLLRAQQVSVTFQKKDGSERVMKCTLQENVVVPYEAKTERTKNKVNEDLIVVWDCENNGWRSFDLNKIQTIEAELS